MGKGQALKTGFRYILDNSSQFADCCGVITVDSDGQHLVRDIVRLSEVLVSGKSGMILGVRDFARQDIPPKSRFGNMLTSKVFKYLYGAQISDTQTGLRGAPLSELDFLAGITGSRFEYETNVLIGYVRSDKAVEEVPIETVYHDNNRSTHFRPIKDSVRIYGNLLKVFLKFSLISILSGILDITIFAIVLKLFFEKDTPSAVAYSILIARAGSSLFNFTLNKKNVFHAHSHTFTQIIKYYGLCAAMAATSILLVQSVYLVTGKEPIVIKLTVDVVLYIINYKVQQSRVFRMGGKVI
jgi:dolichol-phosphate mannosyltransferase